MWWFNRMQSKTLAVVAAAVFALFGTGYVALGIYLLIGMYLVPYQAALLTALVFFLPVLCIWIFFLRTPKSNTEPKPTTPVATDEQAVLASLLGDPELEKWIKRHPIGSLALTTLAGVAVGYSSEARELLKSFSQRPPSRDD